MLNLLLFTGTVNRLDLATMGGALAVLYRTMMARLGHYVALPQTRFRVGCCRDAAKARYSPSLRIQKSKIYVRRLQDREADRVYLFHYIKIMYLFPRLLRCLHRSPSPLDSIYETQVQL